LKQLRRDEKRSRNKSSQSSSLNPNRSKQT
jgi:hypothetical protein